MNENTEWIQHIKPELLEVYPLQFANCDRLRKNDAVYIFDEVGCGKTISSGMMALDYLCQFPGKRVLVITTNSLYKGSGGDEGAFLHDWYDKLPFKELELDTQIDVVNNHYASFSMNRHYGLVILDEAQLFLNRDTRRRKYLEDNVTADKIVFLTATPIKNGWSDLRAYIDIAKAITKKDVHDGWMNEIRTIGKNPEQIICCTFDPVCPVTRYFKDTVMSLHADGFNKNKARRLLPHIWKCASPDKKLETLLENINREYSLSADNKFVIFTKYVEKEAWTIQKYLCDNGFVNIGGDSHSAQKTVAVVTGENSYDLVKYTGKENLPTVLILTYQIAEQGVNLPGFNYVINYHISAYPSALEQRFGRIDRMGKNGSVFSEINMCFLISESFWDTNTWNFYHAVSVYIQNLLAYLPSRNSIISKEILELYGQVKNLVEEYAERIGKLARDEQELIHIKEYFCNRDQSWDSAGKRELTEYNGNPELFAFIEEHGISYKHQDADAANRFYKDVTEKLKEIQWEIGLKKDISIDDYRNIIDLVGDKIFYKKAEYGGGSSIWGALQTLDAVWCASEIVKDEKYRAYSSAFGERIKYPMLISKYRDSIEAYFENLFINNDMNRLFPSYLGYKSVFQQMLADGSNAAWAELSKLDTAQKELLVEHCEEIVLGLPFFKMCAEFRDILQFRIWRKDGYLRDKNTSYHYDPFTRSVQILGRKIMASKDKMGLSPAFVEKYWSKDQTEWRDEHFNDLFKFEQVEGQDSTIRASNWYRLSYHFTRKEEAFQILNVHSSDTELYCACRNLTGDTYWILHKDRMRNPYYRKEYYWKRAYEIIQNSKNAAEELRNFAEQYKRENEDWEWLLNVQKRSLFEEFIWTSGGYKRGYIGWHMRPCGNSRAEEDDMWTKGILDGWK